MKTKCIKCLVHFRSCPNTLKFNKQKITFPNYKSINRIYPKFCFLNWNTPWMRTVEVDALVTNNPTFEFINSWIGEILFRKLKWHRMDVDEQSLLVLSLSLIGFFLVSTVAMSNGRNDQNGRTRILQCSDWNQFNPLISA